MAKLVFGLQRSLDGYVDHLEMGPPGPAVFRHFVEHVRELATAIWRPIESLGIMMFGSLADFAIEQERE